MRVAPLAVVLLSACVTPKLPAVAPLPPPPPAATARVPVPLLRTSAGVRPVKAAVELTVVPEAKTLEGSVRLELEVKEPTSLVWLNATGLTVTRAKFANTAASIIAGNDDFVGFEVATPLKPGRVTLDVWFSGPIDHQRSLGVYAEKEGEETYAYTFFEPIDARRAFPCFDEPSAKIPWSLTLHVKREHLALANSPVVSQTDEAGGMKRVEFAETRPLPSYLVAFVVGPFTLVDGGVAGRAKTPIRFIIPQGREAELAWAKEVSPRVVTALEDWFDMPYPYTKLDVAVVPRYWGTMEHPGLVAMGQPLTLIRPEEATRPRKEHYTQILAHELAHYWFGDLVTTAWWNDTWLNEALGTWMDLIITNQVAPEWQMRDQGRLGNATTAMATDELLSTQPIRLPVETREAIGSAFDAHITYSKGSSVLRMFEAAVGPERWRAFIQRYLRRYEDQNATADDFVAMARSELGDEVSTGLGTFLEQPGVPLITSKAVCQGPKKGLTLSQKRALPEGVVDSTDKRWSLPVCFRAADASHVKRLCTTLSTAETFVPLEFCPTWVMLNDDATGYYRSSVDPKLVGQLFTPSSVAAKKLTPSVAERLMLTADLGASLRRNEVQLDEVLSLVPLMQKDADERVVLAAFGAAFEALDARGLDDGEYAQFLSYSGRLCGARARKLGWLRGADDSDNRQVLRRALLNCATRARDPELTKSARSLLDGWLDGPEKSKLTDDLVGVALSTTARAGDAATFERFVAAANAAPNRNARARLFVGLGFFTDAALARRARELVTAKEYDLRETIVIISIQLGQRETRDEAWAWVKQNLDGLLRRMREDDAARFLASLATSFCDEPHRLDAEQFLSPRAAHIDGAPLELSRSLEQTSQCIATSQRTLPALRRLLRGGSDSSVQSARSPRLAD